MIDTPAIRQAARRKAYRQVASIVEAYLNIWRNDGPDTVELKKLIVEFRLLGTQQEKNG